MQIAFDVTPWRTGHRLRGIGAYIKFLIEALQKYESKHSYLFFTRGENIPKDVDVAHYPYFDPFSLTLPLVKRKPTVVTVHDLIPLAFPDKFPPGIKGGLKWQIQRFSLRSARAVVADSIASKRDVNRLTGFPLERIHVVYLAPAPHFTKVTDTVSLSRIQVKYKLPQHFLLYVGDVNWNKNVPGLLQALAQIKLKGQEIKLVLVGKAFLDEKLSEVQKINEIVEQLHITPDVIRLGYVVDEELPGLYALATAYVQPSLAEGFGLPVLEAMACGCPVVAAKASSLREISGPAIMVDPDDSTDIARGMQDALALSRKERIALGEQGIAWARRFTWEKVAKQTMATYEKAVAGH